LPYPPSHKNATDRGSTDVYGDNGCTCLVFLECCDTDRNNPNYVALPKGTEAIIITPVIDICAVTKAVFPLKFAKGEKIPFTVEAQMYTCDNGCACLGFLLLCNTDRKDAKAITVTVIIDICAVTDTGVFPVNFAKVKFCHNPSPSSQQKCLMFL
jgi:hypothetical protein